MRTFPDPRPINTEHPLFDPIWQAIKRWDIEREHGQGYAGATGTDVQVIIEALLAAPPAAQPAGELAPYRGRALSTNSSVGRAKANVR